MLAGVPVDELTETKSKKEFAAVLVPVGPPVSVAVAKVRDPSWPKYPVIVPLPFEITEI